MSEPSSYPHFRDFYDDKSRSDVVLCFGDERIFAHKLILAGASELFHTAFKSSFPIANQGEYEITGYSPELVHAMINHIYGFSFDRDYLSTSPNAEQMLDFRLSVLLIANEYQVKSLTAAVSSSIVSHLESQSSSGFYHDWSKNKKTGFLRTIQKVTELFVNSKLADTSCLDGIVKALSKHSFWFYEENIQLSKMMEAVEPMFACWIRFTLRAERDMYKECRCGSSPRHEGCSQKASPKLPPAFNFPQQTQKMATDQGETNKFAIHAACRDGQINLAESLLNANPKLAKLRDDDDRLPIHWAASYSRLPIVEILSDRKDFDPDVQDGAGWTPLMIASSLKDSSASETLTTLLLSKSADPTLTTNTGATALHFAASKTNLDTAKKLIEHKASARVKDKRGQLPLHRAAAVGNVPMVKLLLANRSPVNATDGDGCTALHHAVAEGHGDAAVVLLKAGAETDKKDSTGALALDLAPDAKVRDYIVRAADEEGITL
ncbi:putative proteasome regulatory particle subunit [Aureobasidium sp. EXF-10728]|nr:putative proteasome regulatory particle subunit [Aureobasidium sp. EXF-10728]